VTSVKMVCSVTTVKIVWSVATVKNDMKRDNS
jgi:hypothetical protein